jgi:hypothetical protein
VGKIAEKSVRSKACASRLSTPVQRFWIPGQARNDSLFEEHTYNGYPIQRVGFLMRFSACPYAADLPLPITPSII